MKNYKEKRRFKRFPYQAPLDFTVLSAPESDSRRIQSAGSIIDVSEAGIGIMTEFPLEPGHVLQWKDKLRKGNLHIALVKWSRKQDDLYRAGLFFI
ncbi:MAG: PilZ domain-containing protein [Nitrospirota bacterium]